MLNRLIRFSLVSVFALAIAGLGVAHADQHEGGDGDKTETKDDGDKKTDGDGDGDKKTDGDGDATTTDGDGDGDTATAGGKRQGVWSATQNERARTNPKGVISAVLSIVGVNKFENFGAAVGAGYGVSDQLEVGLLYAFGLKDFEAKGDLGLFARYNVISNKDMDITADVGFGYSVLGEAISPLTIGVTADKLLMDRKLNASLNAEVSVTLDGDPKPITLGASLGALYQISGTAKSGMAAGLNIPLVDLSISNSATTVIGADFFAVNAMFMWSNRVIDVALVVGTDLKNSPGDTIVGGLVIGYNMGGNVAMK